MWTGPSLLVRRAATTLLQPVKLHGTRHYSIRGGTRLITVPIPRHPNSNPSILYHCRHGSGTPTDAPPVSTDVVNTVMSSQEQWAADAAQEQWAADAASLLEETEALAGETLGDVGLGGYSPVGLLQSMFDVIHSTTGLPWWMTIVVGTVCLRTAMIPLTIYGRKRARKLQEIYNEVDDIRKAQKMYSMAKCNDRASIEVQKLHTLYQKNGVRPLGAMVPYIGQFALVITNYFALKRMARAPVLSMMTEGTLWFPDLTSPDILLLIVNCGALIAAMRLGDGGVCVPHMAKMRWFFTMGSIMAIPIFVDVPSAFLVFWVTSCSFSITHAVVMKFADHIRGYPSVAVKAKNPIEFFKTFLEDQKLNSLVRAKVKAVKKERDLFKKQMKDKKPKLYKRNPVGA